MYATPAARVGPPAVVTLRTVGVGDLGSRQTLAQMATIARRALTQPIVLQTAQALMRGVPARNTVAQVAALRSWLDAHVQYLNDPPGLELLRTPDYLLQEIARSGTVGGDCDDLAMLAGALGLACGRPVRFVVLGFEGPRGPLAHVYTEVLTAQGWQECDTTRPAGPLPAVTRRIVWEV